MKEIINPLELDKLYPRDADPWKGIIIKTSDDAFVGMVVIYDCGNGSIKGYYMAEKYHCTKKPPKPKLYPSVQELMAANSEYKFYQL